MAGEKIVKLGKTERDTDTIDILDVSKVLKTSNAFSDLDPDDLKTRLYKIKDNISSCSARQSWEKRCSKIDTTYFGGLPDTLREYLNEFIDDEIDDAINTSTLTNKVRELVRALANMLLRERPMFDPDPSGKIEETSPSELEIAARYLEHIWDRGGLRKELFSLVKIAIRNNIGVLKTHWSHNRDDIRFKTVIPRNFWFDTNSLPEDSYFYCEQMEVPFHELVISGAFTPTQLDTIRKEIEKLKKTADVRKDKGEAEELVRIKITEFYIKQRDEKTGELGYQLATFLEDKILIRNAFIDLDDFPYSFFIPEREEGAVFSAHSINDVCNSHIAANILNFKVSKWIDTLIQDGMIVDEGVKVTRSNSSGARIFRTSSTGGRVDVQQVNKTQIPQDVFMQIERLSRAAESNLGVHPSILQGVNGTAPGNGLLASTLLAGDLQNTNMICTEFSLFLSDVAYKVLHLAYHNYKEHRYIRIEPTHGNMSDVSVVGGGVLQGEEGEDMSEKQSLLRENGIDTIQKYPNINVKVVPSSAYTQLAKQQSIIQLLSLQMGYEKYLPGSEVINAFGIGSANLMMNQAAREKKREEQLEQSADVELAKIENQLMFNGEQRAPQVNDDHTAHDQIHAVEEQFAMEQSRRATEPADQQRFEQVLNNIRMHRQMHAQMLQQNTARTQANTMQSPPIIAGQEPPEGGMPGTGMESPVDMAMMD